MFFKLPNINRKLFLASFILLLTLTTQILTNQHTNAQETEIQPLASVSCGVPGFTLPTNINIGASPFFISKGDFNNDGIIDLVTANISNSTISIFLGNNSGSFSAPTSLPTGASPSQIAIDDFNNDGKQDIAVTARNNGNISLFLGSPTTPGTFASAINIPIGVGTVSLASADFNQDGRKDLTAVSVANNGGSLLFVLLANGSGAFSAPVTFTPTNPNFVNVKDINKDGKVDIISSSRSGVVSVLLGDGLGTFAAPMETLTNADSASFSVGDLNNDGNLDVVTANLTTGTGSILLGNGTGSFTLSSIAVGGGSTTAVEIADLNLDGKSDLAFSGSAGVVSFFSGNGDGTFATRRAFPTGIIPNSILSADINRDGKLDLATSNQNGANFSVLTNTFSATCVTPSFATPINATAGIGSLKNAVGDVNLDGNPDVIIANTAGNNFSVLLSNGMGGFSPTIVLSTLGLAPDSIAITDFNKDGKPDLAITNRFSDSLSILLGNGTGIFTLSVTLPVGGINPAGLVVADFNLDSNPDVVTANVNGTGSISIFLGNGTNVNSPTVINVGLNPEVATGDFNKDGKPDIVVSVASLNTINVFLGDGLGGFSSPITFSSGGMMPFIQEVADFNSDGNLDLLISNFASSTGLVFLGNGVGNFTSGLNISSSQRLRFADFNKDGKLDIFAGTDIGNNLRILLGDGSGGVLSTVNLPFTFGNSFTLALADFNFDGRLDLGSIAFSSSIATLGLRLSNCVGAPNSISIVAGLSQNVSIGSNITTPLQVQVFDVNNQPVPNTNIAFNSPDSGASGTFSGVSTANTTTNASGIATSPTFTANNILGSYLVTANANNGSVNICTFFSLTNVKTSTTTSVTSTINPSVFGQSVTFVATVTTSSVGLGIPTGTVQFKNGASNLGGPINLVNGQAQLLVNTLVAGNRSITAIYSGDANFNTSTSPALTQTVNKANTSTMLTVNQNQAAIGQTLTFTATVSAVAPGEGIPTGIVNFMDGATSIGNASINGSGQAILNAALTITGNRTISAVYAGSTNFNGSNSNSVNVFVGAVDRNTLYVADTLNNRIQRSTNNGQSWQFVGNGPGLGLGQFNAPKGVVANFSDTIIFVSDTANNRVQRSTNGGSNWVVIASPGTLTNQVNQPGGLAYDEATDKLYIADTMNNRVLLVNAASTTTPIFTIFASATAGTSIGKFSRPQSVAVSATSAVCVADTGNNRIQMNNNGTETGWSVLAGPGLSIGQVNSPKGVYVDNLSRIWVADTTNNRIQVNINGVWSVFMNPGQILGSVNRPEAMVVNLSGNLFIADTGNNRIQSKPAEGGNAVIVGQPGLLLGQFNQPMGIR